MSLRASWGKCCGKIFTMKNISIKSYTYAYIWRRPIPLNYCPVKSRCVHK